MSKPERHWLARWFTYYYWNRVVCFVFLCVSVWSCSFLRKLFSSRPWYSRPRCGAPSRMTSAASSASAPASTVTMIMTVRSVVACGVLCWVGRAISEKHCMNTYRERQGTKEILSRNQHAVLVQIHTAYFELQNTWTCIFSRFPKKWGRSLCVNLFRAIRSGGLFNLEQQLVQLFTCARTYDAIVKKDKLKVR